jgi:putative NADPH-quinone reductase
MRVLVIACHPVPDSFGASLRTTTVATLRARGHEVRVTDLEAEGFDPCFTAEERRLHLADPSTKPSVARHAENLAWCQMLVLVYPTWWGGQPARLKGWIDRVWINGVAWELPEGANRLYGRLRHLRRIVVVTTHGSSKFVNALQGEPGKRVVSRSLRLMCSPFTRVTWLAAYGLDAATADDRRRFIARVERRLRRY